MNRDYASNLLGIGAIVRFFDYRWQFDARSTFGFQLGITFAIGLVGMIFFSVFYPIVALIRVTFPARIVQPLAVSPSIEKQRTGMFLFENALRENTTNRVDRAELTC